MSNLGLSEKGGGRSTKHLEMAKCYANKLMEDKGNLAVGVFGSVARGEARITSDIDLVVVTSKNEMRFKKEDRKINNVKLDILYYPLSLLKGALSQEISPGAIGALVTILKETKPLIDPQGVFKELIEPAKSFKWKQEIIRRMKDKAASCYSLSQKYAEKELYDVATLQLHSTARLIAAYRLMEKGWLKITKPKDLLEGLRKLDQEFCLNYREISGLRKATPEMAQAFVDQLSAFVEQVSNDAMERGMEDLLQRGGGPIPGCISELGDATDCLEKNNSEGAVLQLQYSAKILSSAVFHFLPSLKEKRPSIYAERYLAAKTYEPQFAKLILKLHSVDGNKQQYNLTLKKLSKYIIASS